MVPCRKQGSPGHCVLISQKPARLSPQLNPPEQACEICSLSPLISLVGHLPKWFPSPSCHVLTLTTAPACWQGLRVPLFVSYPFLHSLTSLPGQVHLHLLCVTRAPKAHGSIQQEWPCHRSVRAANKAGQSIVTVSVDRRQIIQELLLQNTISCF